VDQSKLSQAPTIDSSWSSLRDASWRQRIYSYYGVSASESTGGAESPSGTTKGAGANKLMQGDQRPPGSTQEQQ